MDLVIIVAMITPVALLFVLTPILYVVKLRYDYEKKKNLEFVAIDNALNVFEQILEEGQEGRSYVILMAKDSEYYVQYGYESNGFMLYFFKSQVFSEIHFSKFKSMLVRNNFSESLDKPIGLLDSKEFLELNGGFNVCLGRDVNLIFNLTREIFEKVFEEENLEVNVELEL